MAGRPMVRFSNDLWSDLKVIRKFLFTRMYRAPSVVVVRQDVTRKLLALFPLFMQRPDLLPKQWRKDVAQVTSETDLARIVCDYIAGMTDRFALQQYDELIGED
jgi:dGTPase